MEKDFNIWEGVYKRFEDVPVCGKGFGDSLWLKNSLQKIERRIQDFQSGNSDAGEKNPLASLIQEKMQGRERLRIIDFGGSLGFTYLSVVNALPAGVLLDYRVVEVEQICREGARLFKGDERISFHPSLDGVELKKADIVYLSSALHYMKDWKELLNRLLGFEPDYLLLADLTAGDIPTYATAQNYYGSKIPVWFFNIAEIVNFVKSQGWNFVSIKVNTAELHQNNFPSEYRLGNTSDVLFNRKGQ